LTQNEAKSQDSIKNS